MESESNNSDHNSGSQRAMDYQPPRSIATSKSRIKGLNPKVKRENNGGQYNSSNPRDMSVEDPESIGRNSYFV